MSANRLNQLRTQHEILTHALSIWNENNWGKNSFVKITDPETNIIKDSPLLTITYVRENFHNCTFCAMGIFSYCYALSNKVFIKESVEDVSFELISRTGLYDDFSNMMVRTENYILGLYSYNDRVEDFDTLKVTIELYLELIQTAIKELEAEVVTPKISEDLEREFLEGGKK